MSLFAKVTAGFSAVCIAASLAIAAPQVAMGQTYEDPGDVDVPLYGDNVEYLAGVNVEPGRAIAVNGSPVTSTLFTPPTVTWRPSASARPREPLAPAREA